MANGFLRTSAGKKRPVQDGQLRVPGWIGNRNREETGVLVIHAFELDAVDTG